jgi:hypothetical protein
MGSGEGVFSWGLGGLVVNSDWLTGGVRCGGGFGGTSSCTSGESSLSKDLDKFKLSLNALFLGLVSTPLCGEDRAYIVTGLVLTSAVSAAGPLLEIVELRFRAADATKPPAPRVEVGIVHGMEGFVGDEDSLVRGSDSERERVSSSNVSEARAGEEWDAAKRETVV